MINPDERKGARLVEDLLSNPDRFTREGLANDLLKEFQHGYSISNLSRLLQHDNGVVVQRAIWIASELPALAPKLLRDAIALTKHLDRYVRYYALDVITLGTADAQQEQFARVAERLEDSDASIVERAVYLIAHASERQLIAAKRAFEQHQPGSPHIAGLSAILTARSADHESAESMMKSVNSLERRYALAAAERAHDLFPHLMELAAESTDVDIRRAAAALEKMHSGSDRTR